jgi:catechol-2,3-dioxygenase
VSASNPVALVRGLAEFTLESEDLAAMESFYSQLIGLEVLSRDEDRVWLALDGSTRLGLWTPGRKEFGDRGGRHVHFAFSATRGALEAMRTRLRKRGVEVSGPVEHEGGDRSLYFRDPAGNLVEAWDFFHDGDGADEGTEALK